MQKSVVIATPSLDSRVTVDFLNSCLDVRLLLLKDRIPHSFRQESGDCFVAKARNKLVTQFLEDHPEATDLFFLDDDIGFPAEKFIEFIKRDEEIVAGVYPKKQDQLDFPVGLIGVDGNLVNQNGLYSASLAPTGFMRIKRQVLEDLASQATQFKDAVQGGGFREYYNIFETGRGSDGMWWGEDYTFCQKAALAGYPVWVDPNIQFSHRGGKRWVAALADHLGTFSQRAKELSV